MHIKAIALLKLLVISLISKREIVGHQYHKNLVPCLFVTKVLIKENFNSCIPNSIGFQDSNTDAVSLLQFL